MCGKKKKESAAVRETWVPSLGWEDPLEKGKSYPLQYSGLENSMDRGAWQAVVHGVAKSQTWLVTFTFIFCGYLGSEFFSLRTVDVWCQMIFCLGVERAVLCIIGCLAAYLVTVH